VAIWVELVWMQKLPNTKVMLLILILKVSGHIGGNVGVKGENVGTGVLKASFNPKGFGGRLM